MLRKASNLNSSVFRVKDSKEHEKKRKKIAKNLTLLPFALPKFFEKKEDPSSKLISKYMDREGMLPALFSAFLLKEKDKVDWLKFWMQIDEPGTNIVSYSRLMAHFHMEDSIWSQRLFDIANYTFTGYLSFIEFFQFCTTYLMIDKENIKIFTFRMLSRRAATYNDSKVVLDLTDIKFFVKDRYESRSISQKNKRALAIFSNMDHKKLGGVNATEFMEYSDSHFVFTRLANKFLVHLRKCIFGVHYWTVKSRKVKRNIAKGMNQLSRSTNINKDSEHYCSFLGDPVIDAKSNPLKDSFINGAAILDDDEDAYADEKSLLTFKGPFNKDSLPLGLFEEDFPEVVQQHHQEKLLRKQRKAEKMEFADLAAMSVYKRLVDVCSDFLDPKSKIRHAFKQWVLVIRSFEDEKNHQDTALGGDDEAAEESSNDVYEEFPELADVLRGTIWRFMSGGLDDVDPARQIKIIRAPSTNELVTMSVKDKKRLMVDMLHGRSELGRVAGKIIGDGEGREETLHERIIRTTTALQTFSDADICADYLEDYLNRAHYTSMANVQRTRGLTRR